MLTVRASQGLSLRVPLDTTATPSAATCTIEDGAGTVLGSPAAIPAAGAVSLIIDGAINALDAAALADVRRVRVSFQLTGNPSYFETEMFYRVEQAQALGIMQNSFQLYNTAVLLASELTNLQGWEPASRSVREAALGEAYRVLVRLRYDLSCTVDRQSTLVSEYPFGQPGDIWDYTAEQFLALDPRFILALRRAQVLEADAILVKPDDMRTQGILSSTEGQASQMYRSGKPLERAISKRATQALVGYLSLRPRLSRV